MIRRLFRRRWVRIVSAVLGVLVLYYAITAFQVWSTGRANEARKVDAIVVMGAAQYDGRPSPVLAARLDHVLDLYRAGDATTVVVTGGKLPGDRFTEADTSAKYLIARGVPAGALLREETAHNSYDSLRTVAGLLRSKGLHSVLLVSDPFHCLRVRLIAEELGLQAFTSPTRTSPIRGAAAAWRELKEAAGIALGRIIGFRRLTSLTG